MPSASVRAAAARGLQLHQRDEPEDLGLARHQLGEHVAEAQRLLAEVVPHEGVTGVRSVALVEDQVDDGEHGGQARGQLGALGHLVRQAAVADRALGAHEPLGDRGLGHEEGARDLRRREAADEPRA